MSQYFSRLAERSGVATAAQAAQNKSAQSSGLSDWSEQANEVTASVESRAHDRTVFRNSHSDRPANDISATGQSKTLPDTISTTVEQIQHRVSAITPATGLPSVAIDLNMDLDSKSYNVENVSRVSSQDESTVGATDFLESGPNASGWNDNDGRMSETKVKSKTPIDKTSRFLVDSQSENSTASEFTLNYKTVASKYDDANLAETHEGNSGAVSRNKLEHSKATPSRQQLDKEEQVGRVSSSSVRPLSGAVTPAHSSLKSSVQVNIGKIELEIHAPAANRAPQLIKSNVASAPAVSRHLAFNPHRHYLRGR
jgi:hypothetical protein